jgi:hypothetical protein
MSPGSRAGPAPTHQLDDVAGVPRRPRRWQLAAAIAGVALVGAAVVVLVRPGSGPAQVVHGGADAGTPSSPGRAIDAAAIAQATDAAIAQAADAIPAIADAATAISPATFDGKAKRFAFQVTVTPGVPDPDQPFELAVTLTDLDPALRAAAVAGTLTANLELAYFKDHVQVHASTHRVGLDGKFTVVLSVPRVAKHHAHLDLLINGREVDHAHFDLFPTLEPR